MFYTAETCSFLGRLNKSVVYRFAVLFIVMYPLQHNGHDIHLKKNCSVVVVVVVIVVLVVVVVVVVVVV